jgi:hypothetical protein
MVTLAALCNTVGLRIDEEAERELARVWTKIDAIRAKQAAKPTGSALPVALSAPQGEVERLREALDGVDCISRLRDELGGKIELTWLEPKQSWPLFNLLSEVNSGLAALAQPEAGGEHE